MFAPKNSLKLGLSPLVTRLPVICVDRKYKGYAWLAANQRLDTEPLTDPAHVVNGVLHVVRLQLETDIVHGRKGDAFALCRTWLVFQSM